MEVEFQAAEKAIEEDLDAGVQPSAYVDRAATWDVNPTTTRETFAKQYLRNPERAKRVYECVGGGSDNSFFRFREEVRGRCHHDRKSPTGNVWRIADPAQLVLEPWFKAVPNTHYHVHIDLATGIAGNDKVGFVMGHTYETRPTWSEDYLQRLQIAGQGVDPNGSGDFRTAVFIDLAMQFIAPNGGEVRFAGIIDFLSRLRGLGFDMSVSYDGWQSRGEIQRLQDLGFIAELLSVDRTPEPANTTKELWYAGLVNTYTHPVLLREAEELEEDPKTRKVDHPEKSKRRLLEEGESNGSKDVWDACAATTWYLTTRGAGAYRIGFGMADETDVIPAGVKVVEEEVLR
jgi:hypothetical protein